MIQIQKGTAPNVLLKKGAEFQHEAVAYHNDPGNYDGSFKPQFDKHAFEDGGILNGFTSKLFTLYSFYSDPAVKRQLIQEHSGKCAFCESFIMDTDVGDVEHYRPKSEVTEIDRSEERPVPNHPGYFWLSQTWENLFLSCKQCNQAYKRTRFDVVPSGLAKLDEKLGELPRLPVGKGPDFALEVPALLYPGPGDVDPRKVIRFDPATAKAYPIEGGTDAKLNILRANRTIELVGLNRVRLLESRAAHLLHLRGLFILAATQGYVDKIQDRYSIFDFKYAQDCAGKDAQDALRLATSEGAEFSALAQDALDEWTKELKLAKSDAKVTQKEVIQLDVNVDWKVLRLDKQIKLLEDCRKASAKAIDQEAEPDTYDLDLDYNEALATYKQIVGRASKDKKKIQTAKAQVKKMSRENKKLNDHVESLRERIWEIDEQLRKLDVSDTDRKQKLEKEKQGLQEELKKPEEMDDRVLENIDQAGEICSNYSTLLVELKSDVLDLQMGYENCGGKVKDRTKRTEQLEESIDNLLDWLDADSEKELSKEVQNHFQKKGWPPRITGL